MASLSSYRELLAWQQSISLAVRIYEVTRSFPADERFGITSQIRRAATSIPANFAEGQARRTTGEFLQSLGIARGSLAEVETFLVLSQKLAYLKAGDCDALLSDYEELNKMLNGLMKSLPTRH